MRKVLNLNSTWKFIKQDVVNAMDVMFNDCEWENVNVPHT